jgi:hypothetical protein
LQVCDTMKAANNRMSHFTRFINRMGFGLATEKGTTKPNNSQQKMLHNSTVYINHPYIVTVRKAINAFVSGDFETWAGYFSPKARFTTSSMKPGESMSLEEYKQTLIDRYFKDDLQFKQFFILSEFGGGNGMG